MAMGSVYARTLATDPVATNQHDNTITPWESESDRNVISRLLSYILRGLVEYSNSTPPCS